MRGELGLLNTEIVAEFLKRLDGGFAHYRVHPASGERECTSLEVVEGRWAVTYSGGGPMPRTPVITCETEHEACLAFVASIADLEAGWKGHNPNKHDRPWSEFEFTVQKACCIFRLCVWVERYAFQRVESNRFGDLEFVTQYDSGNGSRSIRIGLKRNIWRAEEEVDSRLVVIAECASEHEACSAAVARVLECEL